MLARSPHRSVSNFRDRVGGGSVNVVDHEVQGFQNSIHYNWRNAYDTHYEAMH
jgi:hypothetical protein